MGSESSAGFQKTVALDDFEHLHPCGTGYGIAAVGRTVTACTQQVAERTALVEGTVGNPECPKRKAVCNALGP